MNKLVISINKNKIAKETLIVILYVVKIQHTQ